MKIREFDTVRDLEGIRACLIELQDYECRLDPRMPAGVEVVDPLFSEMMVRCDLHNGRVFVAVEGEDIAGYVTVLARVMSEEIDDGDLEYGLITDLVVRECFRSRGAARQLLEAAEGYAIEGGARWLRIEVLAGNHTARGLYESRGFIEHVVSLEKPLSAGGDDN